VLPRALCRLPLHAERAHVVVPRWRAVLVAGCNRPQLARSTDLRLGAPRESQGSLFHFYESFTRQAAAFLASYSTAAPC
jgi:hypothetical protein